MSIDMTTFTPYAKEYTMVYFEAQGIQTDDMNRLVFKALNHDGAIPDEFTKATVTDAWDRTFNVYVKTSDCGAACRCAAEIKLGNHPSREYRKARSYTDDDGYLQHDWVPVPCGEWWDGGNVYCQTHYEWYAKLYPQGWASYPGDVCRHGVYIGGSGIDWMCGQCEMGDDQPQLTDSEAIDHLVRFVRTPEWSVSMLEDIADIVRLARPDIGEDFDPEDPQCWTKH